MQIDQSHDPFVENNALGSWRERGHWPCAWVKVANLPPPPVVAAYQLAFSLDSEQVARIHVAADERYDLYLDGEWLGRGNERGAPDCWFFETYALPLRPGPHVIVARVWSLGDQAAQAQMQVAHGFLLAAEGDLLTVLSTGIAPWQAKVLAGYRFLPADTAHWRGARVDIDGQRFPWGFTRGEGSGWQPVEISEQAMGRFTDWEFHHRHLLRPASLPAMLRQPVNGARVRYAGRVPSLETRAIPIFNASGDRDAMQEWQRFLAGGTSLTIPAEQAWRVLIDLEQYHIAFSRLVTTGGAGAVFRLHWAESLYTAAAPWNSPKGNRDETEGKYFVGYGDVFRPDGGQQRCFEPLWWMAGRYLEICVQTGAEALQIERLDLVETRYPLAMEGDFSASDPRLEAVVPLLVRGVQMCANETFFDCPYYEELQYAGDTRLECLVTYVMTRDDRLPRKAIRLFDLSRRANGLTQSRYPSRVMQIIPPFALWWVMMVRDYAYWRADVDFARDLLPGVRATLEGFERFLGADGLLYGPEGWNTIDWVPAWDEDAGVPPDGHAGASGILNGQLIYTLLQAADLEAAIGEPALADLYRRRAQRLSAAVFAAFWDEQRGMLADNLAHTCFSEHAQCFLLLSETLLPGLLPVARRERMAEALLSAPDLSRATIYFSHYLFETLHALGRVDVLFERLVLWFGLMANGLKTTIEMPEPSRSDCHGWGAHPLYQYYSTILGIRPAAPGFREIEIAPQPGVLERAAGRLPHPGGGWVEVVLYRQNGLLKGRVSLPAGVPGVLRVNGETRQLQAGETVEF